MPTRRSSTLGLIVVAAFSWLAWSALGFNASGQRWPGGEIVMHLQLGSADTPLIDGAASWDAVAEEALSAWNSNVVNVRFAAVRGSTAPTARNNGINNVFWSSTVFDDAWDPNTVAITLLRYDSRTSRYSESDVIFNDTRAWNSYRGPLRSAGPGVTLNDIRRIALHEFGHVLGLNHPDGIGQTVEAIMNAQSSGTDNLTGDDIAGVRSIYDNPNAVPTALLSMNGTIGYSTQGATLNLRVERVRNDGDVASGPIRLELWAMPQHYAGALPSGSVALGTHIFPNALPPNSGVSNVNVNTTYSAPPAGSYYVVMLLTEFTGASGSGYTVRDAIEFDNPLNIGNPTIPAITRQPASVAVMTGDTATFTAVATGTLPRTYQWRKDGSLIFGAIGTTLTIPMVSPADAGLYTIVVSNTLGTVTSNPARLSVSVPRDPANPGRLINMSVRTNAGTGDNTLIVGAGLGGAGTSGTKAVLIRAVGPTLGASFGVSGALGDSVLTVFHDSTQIAQNDDWAGSFDFAAVGAFNFSGMPPRDAAFYKPDIAAGSYSIQITGKNNTTGIVLAEIYDATPPASVTTSTPRLVNLSARAQVGTGDNILIAGFVVGGTTAVRVLVRAVGPTLGAAPFNIGGALANPRVDIHNATSEARVADNDDWGGGAELKAAFTSVGAFPFATDTSGDAALVATLEPGNYTVQVSGVGNTTGIALVEVYELP